MQTVPTPDQADHSTRVANTAFVHALVNTAVTASIPKNVIVMWSGSVAAIPATWVLCDGSNGTPDLRSRFVVGAGGNYAVGSIGGESFITLTEANMPPHTHSAWTDAQGNHQHTGTTDVQGNHQHTYNGHVSQAHFQYGAGGGNASIGTPYKSAGTTDAAGNHAHNFATSYAGQHQHNVGIGIAGGGQAHENRPPFYALCFIMKI